MKTLQAIERPSGGNISGILALRLFALTDVDAIYDADNYPVPPAGGQTGMTLASGSVDLKSGATPIEVFISTRGTFTENKQTSDAGEYWQQTITAQTPSATPDHAVGFDALQGHYFIAEIKDSSLRYRLVGSIENPLRLDVSQSGFGYSLTLSGQSINQAFFLAAPI